MARKAPPQHFQKTSLGVDNGTARATRGSLALSPFSVYTEEQKRKKIEPSVETIYVWGEISLDGKRRLFEGAPVMAKRKGELHPFLVTISQKETEKERRGMGEQKEKNKASGDLALISSELRLILLRF
ncbi:hypothetical protein TNCV_2007031 [Trichonephila clavipes]|nr:hypothetical protein TNCV_2007031 [Trichonephila clavipes]